MSSNQNISIIIVNYNSSEKTNKLIKSLSFIKKIINEIIIIDNNSNDLDKLKKQKNVRITKNSKNFGFAKAVNQGIKKSKSDFILLLNPDSELIDNSIEILFEKIINNKKIGAIGGKIIYKNKEIYSATNTPNFLTGLFEFTNLKKIFSKNKFSLNFWPEKKDNIKNSIEVTSLCGAFILFRKFDQKNQLNLLNEDYFLYLEDLDFGIKLKEKGYKIIFDPNSSINHIGGASSGSKYNIVLKYWYKSRKIFFKKHLNKISGLILYMIFTIEEFLLKKYHNIKHEPFE